MTQLVRPFVAGLLVVLPAVLTLVLLGWIGNLIVSPERRRSGVGSELMAHALQHLQGSGMRTVRLDAIGYRGDYSFEVFNDDYVQLPLATVAARARESVRFLVGKVARRLVAEGKLVLHPGRGPAQRLAAGPQVVRSHRRPRARAP